MDNSSNGNENVLSEHCEILVKIMSTLCRFVLPSTLSTVEEACVAEFNEYKKRMKELSNNKSANKRFANITGGVTSNAASTRDSSNSLKKDSTRDPENAKEVAKRLVQSGAIKVQTQSKDQGFKRATSSSSSSNGPERMPKKMNLTPNTSSPSSSNQTNPFQPIPFVNSNSTSRFINMNSHENKRHVVNYDDADAY